MLNNKILIDLDCLLDTRLAIMFKLNKEVIKEILQDGYHNRITDKVDNIDFNEYTSLYEKRDNTILRESTVTTLTVFLLNYLQALIHATTGTPAEIVPEIIINVHPYTLTEDEIKELIMSVSYRLDNKFKIDTLNLSKKELNPKWLKENIHTLFMYDYNNWLEIQSEDEEITKTPIPEVTLFAPKIIFSGDIPKDNKIEGAFKRIETFIKPFINLNLIDAYIFSTVLYIEKEK